MQSQTFKQARLLGAVLKYDQNQNYTRKSGVFTNSGTEAVSLEPGIIFTGGDTPAVFDTASPEAFTGLNITTEVVQPGASVHVAWVERGAVIVNTNEVDFPEDAPQRAALVTAMEAAGFKLVAGLD